MAWILRLKSLLDLYSPRPVNRLAVLTCMAVGTWLLWRGLETGSGNGAIPFVLLVWANHERFLATVESLLRARPAWVLGIPLAVFAARLAMFPPTASDDLLRHIASAFWPGGYRDMYVETALPPVGLYPWFDLAVGLLARRVGPAPAMWTVQALAVISFVTIFVIAARRAWSARPMWAVATLVVLAVVLHVMSTRLFLGRPEVFMMVWALSALLVGGRTGTIVWSLAGVVLSGGYWLAPLYFPAVILIDASWRRRATVLAAMAVAWALLWWHLADGHPIEAMQWTLAQVAHRIPGMQVQENVGIFGVLLMPPMLVLAFLSIWAAARPGADHRLLWLAGYFLLSNQARYVGIVAPLLGLYVLRAWATLPTRWPRICASAIVAVACASLSLLANGVPRYHDLPRFGLPPGAVVLTGFSEATYSTPFANPGSVRVSPAFEIGAASSRVQRMVIDLAHGSIDCAALSQTAFTHLIERDLRGPASPCLALEQVQGGWRLWRIRQAVQQEGR